jgi:hypothetical protein
MAVLACIGDVTVEVHPIAAQDWEMLPHDISGIPVFHHDGKLWPRPDGRVRINWDAPDVEAG